MSQELKHNNIDINDLLKGESESLVKKRKALKKLCDKIFGSFGMDEIPSDLDVEIIKKDNQDFS